MTDCRLAVRPGPGVVQRTGATAAIVLGDPTPASGSTAGILDLCRTRHGVELVRALAQAALSSASSDAPPFAVVTDTPQGLLLFLRGEIEAVVRSGLRTTRIDGREAVTWIERILPAPVDHLAVGTPGHEAAPTDGWSDLRAGVVPGGGVALVPLGAPAPEAPAAAAEPADAPPAAGSVPVGAIGAVPTPPAGSAVVEPRPAPGPAATPEEFRAEILLGAAPPPAPRPPLSVHTLGDDASPPADPVFPVAVVPGVRCSRDHHNNPAALYCSSCGIKMGVHRTLVVVDGPRPPLGVLVIDDGATIPVRQDMVIGRDPSVDPLVVAGEAQPIRLEDETSSVSRAHLLVALDGWDVLIADRGSSNGTFVRSGESGDWRQLSAAERLGITAGAEIRIGDRLLIFEQHHVL